MARDTFTAQALSHGLQPASDSLVSASGAQVAYDATAFLYVFNDGGDPINLSVRTNVTLDGDLALPDRVITIPDGQYMFSKAFARSVYRENDGFLYLDADADGLLIAVLKP